MGLPGLRAILERLVEHGMAHDMPAVLVEKATLPEQRIVQGNVTNLAERVEKAGIVGPTTIIIGEVVGPERPVTRVFRSLTGTFHNPFVS